MRCHLYQGRSLLAADSTGLSDPFARILFLGHSAISQVVAMKFSCFSKTNTSICIQVINQTLNPTWDETIVIQEVTLYGLPTETLASSHTVVVELFDQDRIVIVFKRCSFVSHECYFYFQGPGDFIGQCLAQPVVKLLNDPYVKPNFPPVLQWYPVYRGVEQGGEILAAFELLQVSKLLLLIKFLRYFLYCYMFRWGETMYCLLMFLN